jgi:alkanesulfonate monooxygenase SsuD/methylene tetrahydromethanopterin reductase-like flavin-dependent oxidoreductase (luciferase family)
MRLGAGLPSVVPGTGGSVLVEWARAAEEHGFTALGVIDRVVYDGYEPLIALAAAAAATTRVGLMTTTLVGPARPNAAVLAKQLASIDAISGGRLTVGLSIGSRAEDYEVGGVPLGRRGRRLEEQIDEFVRVWAAGAIGPARPRRPRLLLGGYADAVARRVASHADGWIGGAAGVQRFRELAPAVRKAWADAGRDGTPGFAAVCYFALGPGTAAAAEQYLLRYYAYAGDAAPRIAAGAVTDAAAVAAAVAAYAEAGCDELLFFPCSAEVDELARLAEVVGDLPDAELAPG